MNTAVGIDKTFNGIFTASVEAGIKKYVKNDFKTGVKVNRQAFDSSSKFLDTMGYVNAGLILNLNDDTTYGLYYQGIGGKDNFSHTGPLESKLLVVREVGIANSYLIVVHWLK